MRRRKRGRYGGGGKQLPGAPLEYPICPTCQRALFPHKVEIHAKLCGKTNPMARSMIAETLAPDLGPTPTPVLEKPKGSKKKKAPKPQEIVISASVLCPTCKKQIARSQLISHRRTFHTQPTIISPALPEGPQQGKRKSNRAPQYQNHLKHNLEPATRKSAKPTAKYKVPTFPLTLKQARAKSPRICARCQQKHHKLYCRGRKEDGTLIYYCYVCIGYREQQRAERSPRDAMDAAFWTQKTFDGLDTDERATKPRPKGKTKE